MTPDGGNEILRLTLVIAAMGAGGAERVLSIMANHWAARGHIVTVLTFDDGSQPPFYRMDARVRRTALDLARASRGALEALVCNLWRIAGLRRALRASRPDAVISFMTETSVLTLLAACGLGVPVLVSEHSDPWRFPLGRSWAWLRRWSYRFASRIVVLNGQARTYFSQRLQPALAVIPNPVLAPPKAAVTQARARQVVAMGRFTEQKGFDLLLRAFAEVRAPHPDWTLVIVGDGPLRAELTRLARALGLESRVRLAGVAHDPYAVLGGSELFVLSSRYEAFPMALCEAMASGMAVITTEYHHDVREIVNDGENGLLVPANDVAALAAAMDRLMAGEAERRRLGSRAVEICGRYGVERVMGLWDGLLAGTVRRAGTR
jgi:glycosyltransferase involved in cell wall biosynthesis